MNSNEISKLESRKRHAWDVACQTVVVTREDVLQVYDRLMKQFEKIDPIDGSHKAC
jgi:hypothetical protein